MRIISIGEILWDVYGDKEFVGGAPFNFCINLSKLRQNFLFISAIGNDERGKKILDLMLRNGLSTQFINTLNKYPTGYVNINRNSKVEPTFNIVKSVAYNYLYLTKSQLDKISLYNANWIYVGTLCQMSLEAKKLTFSILKLFPKAKCFYDLNLREGHYSNFIIEKLLNASAIVKMNLDEYKISNKIFYKKKIGLKEFCKKITKDFLLDGICITMGERGSAVYYKDEYILTPAKKVNVIDTIGAGDAFAAGFIYGINNNLGLFETCKFANQFASKTLTFKGSTNLN